MMVMLMYHDLISTDVSTASTATKCLTFDDRNVAATVLSSLRCIGGRRKGTTHHAKLEHSIKLSSAITKAFERSKAKAKDTTVRSGIMAYPKVDLKSISN